MTSQNTRPDFHSAMLQVIGPMPTVLKVAEALWGQECIFDSDGDAQSPSDTGWRRLMLCLREMDPEVGFYRSNEEMRVEIAATAQEADVICIQARDKDLLNRTENYLVTTGAVRRL